MRLVELGCLAKIDRTPATDDEVLRLPFVGLEHIEKGTGNFIDDNVEVSADELLATKFRFTPSHVLYGKLRPNLNKVALPNFEGVCTTEILPLLPDPSLLDRTYLWGALLHSDFVKWASHIVQGANLPRLSPTDLAQYQVPMPDLPPAESLAEQRRIAAILSAADGERRRRRYVQSAQSDRFAQDLFVEMFGDPATNPLNWKTEHLGGLLAVPPRIGTVQPARSYGKQRCVRVGEIGKHRGVSLNECAYVTLNAQEFARYQLYSNDFLLARAIGSQDHLGKFSIMQPIHEDIVFDSHVMRIRVNPRKLNIEYFATFLHTPGGRRRFLDQTRQTAVQFNVNAEQIQVVEIPLPPIELQEEFAKTASQVNVVEIQQDELEHQTDHLFQSLLDHAFRGEL